MTNKLLRVLTLCLSLALLAGATLPGYAAAKPSIQKGDLWVGSPKQTPILLDFPDEAKITSFTSSNPSMLKVGKQKNFGPWGLWMQPLKVGVCKITIKYRLKGKTKSMSQNITIRKYPDPITWLKVNGKKVSLTKHKYTVEYKNYKKDSFRINFKLSKDWKVENLAGAYWIGDDRKGGINWKKDKKYKLPDKFDSACVAIDMRNKKTGDFFNYEIWFYR